MNMHDEGGPALRAWLTRRQFVRTGVLGAAGVAAGCLAGPTEGAAAGGSRLRSRPGEPGSGGLTPGTHSLEDAIDAEATLYVPSSWSPDVPARLFVMLHGAGASRNGLDGIFPLADPHGMLVLLPKSQGRTWDLVLGGFGPDVAMIDRALAWIFERCAVDPAGVCLGGFSDGGSYALSLGLGNGDLFGRIAAFSPGFMAPAERIGTPSILMVHGVQDTILPIAGTSREITAQLRAWAYALDYEEFDGPHTIRAEDLQRAFAWMAG